MRAGLSGVGPRRGLNWSMPESNTGASSIPVAVPGAGRGLREAALQDWLRRGDNGEQHREQLPGVAWRLEREARGGHGAVARLGGEERGHPAQVGGDGAPSPGRMPGPLSTPRKTRFVSVGRMRGWTWGEGPCPHSCTTRGQT